MCFGSNYLFKIHSVPLKAILKGKVAGTHKMPVRSNHAEDCSKLQITNYKLCFWRKKDTTPQTVVFSTAIHYRLPFQLPFKSHIKRHMSWRPAVDVAAGATQVTERF